MTPVIPSLLLAALLPLAATSRADLPPPPPDVLFLAVEHPEGVEEIRAQLKRLELEERFVDLPDPEDRPLRIVAFGDSTTAPRKTVSEVYAARLPVLLAAQGIEAEVLNRGRGGSHTGRLADNARHRGPHALDRLDESVRAERPDLVVVQFGINDCWVDEGGVNGRSRIPPAAYRENLETIVALDPPRSDR